MCDFTTSGSRSESTIIADKQTQFKWNKENYKWFSPSLDGRREGIRRTPEYKSTVDKQGAHFDWNALSSDYMLNQTRRPNIVYTESKASEKWQTVLGDQDFSIMKYMNNKKNSTCRIVDENKVQLEAFETSRNPVHQDTTQLKKLAKNIIKGISAHRDYQVENMEYNNNVVQNDNSYKSVNILKNDLSKALNNGMQDQTYQQSDHSMLVKTQTPETREHLMRSQRVDTEFMKHNKEMISKNVSDNKNQRKIVRKIAYDNKQQVPSEDFTRSGKSLNQTNSTILKNKKIHNYDDQADQKQENMITRNYKMQNQPDDMSIRKTSIGYKDSTCFTSMDNSQIRRPGKVGQFVMQPGEFTQSMTDNAIPGRQGGRVGSKTIYKYQDASLNENQYAESIQSLTG
jgi:hypothetical protein